MCMALCSLYEQSRGFHLSFKDSLTELFSIAGVELEFSSVKQNVCP